MHVSLRSLFPLRLNRGLSILLMNLWVYPLLTLWTVLGSIASMPLLFLWTLVSGWPLGKTMRFFIWIYGRVCLFIMRPFVKIDCINLEYGDFYSPGIVVFNHCSFVDTYFVSKIPVFDGHIGVRAWPFRMPWYYLFMRIAAYMNLEDSSWEKIQSDAGAIFDDNKYLVIFPEGHRSRTGKIGRFHSGAFNLSVRYNVPIFPVCITGTHDLLPPGRWWFEPSRVSLKLIDPVEPGKFQGENAHIELRKYVKKMMAEAIDQMKSQAAG